MRRNLMILVLGALAAVLLQVVLAPNIAIFAAMPNLMVVYALIVAILRPDTRAVLVIAFILGLVFDLLSHTPVGAMAFLLVLFSFLASRLFSYLENDTFFMPVLIFCAAALAIELLYSLFVLLSTTSAGFVDLLIYRALPCALYDWVVGLILYPVMMRLFAGGSATPTPKTTALGPSARGSVNVSVGKRRRVKTKKKMPRF